MAQVSLATSLHLDFSVFWVCTHQDSANWLLEQGWKQSTYQAFLVRLMHVSCGMLRYVAVSHGFVQNEDYSWILLKSLVCLIFAVMPWEGCVAHSVEPRWSIMIFHPTWTPSQNRRCTCLHLEKWWDHVMCRHHDSCRSLVKSWGGCIVVGRSAVSGLEIGHSIWKCLQQQSSSRRITCTGLDAAVGSVLDLDQSQEISSRLMRAFLDFYCKAARKTTKDLQIEREREKKIDWLIDR